MHRSVLVVVKDGQRLEDVLDPFDESLEVPAHVVPVDVAQLAADARGFGSAPSHLTSDEQFASWFIDQQVCAASQLSGDEEGFTEDIEWFYWSTSNRDGHWDWWTVNGSRWPNELPVRAGRTGFSANAQGGLRQETVAGSTLWVVSGPGYVADAVRVRDWDRALSANELFTGAQAMWDVVSAATAACDPLVRWEQFAAEHGFDSAELDFLRHPQLMGTFREFLDQPWLVAASTAANMSAADVYEHMCLSSPSAYDDFMFVSAAVPPVAAFVVDGQWLQMPSLTDGGALARRAQVAQMVVDALDTLDDDDLVVIVDTHF